MERRVTLYSLKGVQDAEVSTHYFSTADKLGLSMLRFQRAPSDDVVLIVHGLTTSTDMFVMPEHYNLVSYMLDQGFGDVWCLDYRMSNRHPFNLQRHRYTLDDIALFDHPAAVAKIREAVGAGKRIHVISHCLGAASFAMSVFAKAVEVDSLIANSVALTPRVSTWSRMKIAVSPFVVEYVLGLPYLNPNWGEEPGWTKGKLMAKMISMGHRECDVGACHMLSMMWGNGHPALYSHENLDEITHRRGGDLYGPTSVHYYRHVRRMLNAGRAVKYDTRNAKHQALPDDYLQSAAEIETPVMLTTGEDNYVFTDSNVVCHEALERAAPGRHELKVYPRYGHQDVFMGKNVAADIFPSMVEFIRRRGGARPSGAVAGPDALSASPRTPEVHRA
ncbi:MAG TPA: alpha/beta fold hydrolase [Gemmatimonadaceae bacterium]|nr:alpha/beta fold hydrolase [Gemmatimonadaceae bacterium]